MTIKAVYRHAQDGHLLETWDYDVRCHTYVRYAIGYIALIIKPYLDVERLGIPVVLFRDFLISLAVMAAIVLLMREPLTWNWLLVVPAIALLTMFNLGLALFLSRLVAQVRDINQVLPFVIRIWMYISGVFFSVTMVSDRLPHSLNWVLEANPMATYISLVRDCLMYSEVSQPWAWWAGTGWAIFALVGGFWFFYRAEERYGRG